jgi:hypothetical protein
VINSPAHEERDTTLVGSRRPESSSRFASHAIAAVLIILLASFGLFCRYYQWKMPPTATQDVGIATPASVEIHAEVNSSARVNRLALRSSKKKESLRAE